MKFQQITSRIQKCYEKLYKENTKRKLWRMKRKYKKKIMENEKTMKNEILTETELKQKKLRRIAIWVLYLFIAMYVLQVILFITYPQIVDLTGHWFFTIPCLIVITFAIFFAITFQEISKGDMKEKWD